MGLRGEAALGEGGCGDFTLSASFKGSVGFSWTFSSSSSKLKCIGSTAKLTRFFLEESMRPRRWEKIQERGVSDLAELRF